MGRFMSRLDNEPLVFWFWNGRSCETAYKDALIFVFGKIFAVHPIGLRWQNRQR